VFIVSVIVII